MTLHNSEKFNKLILLANSWKYGHQVSQFFVVTDLANFGIQSFTSKLHRLIQIQTQRMQDYFPEMLAGCLVVNAPWGFSSIYAICKSFLDEKTRQRVSIIGANPYQEICKHINEEHIPDFLGGPNTTPLIQDDGPWKDYTIVNGHKKGDLIGVQRKSDGPNGRIFNWDDFESLPNNLLKDPNNSVLHFEKHKQFLIDRNQFQSREQSNLTSGDNKFTNDYIPSVAKNVNYHRSSDSLVSFRNYS